MSGCGRHLGQQPLLPPGPLLAPADPCSSTAPSEKAPGPTPENVGDPALSQVRLVVRLEPEDRGGGGEGLGGEPVLGSIGWCMHGLCPPRLLLLREGESLDGRGRAGSSSEAPEAAEASGLKAADGHRPDQRVTPGGMEAPGFLQGKGTLSSCPPTPHLPAVPLLNGLRPPGQAESAHCTARPGLR